MMSGVAFPGKMVDSLPFPGARDATIVIGCHFSAISLLVASSN
jgi:hypothetical protein